MDRLIEAITNVQNPSVVGLDPTEALVPPQVVASFAEEVRDSVDSPEELPAAQLAVAYFEFNRTIINAVADIVPAVKPQIAMYEALGPAGVDVYTMTCEYAAQQGLYVLGDIKRGDIGSTAAAYAHHLSGVGADAAKGDDAADNGESIIFDPWHEDAVTVNPYLGTDGITPFVDAAVASDKDIFVLVRTSNPSSSELQMLDLADGTKVYEHVADLVEGWGAETRGQHGYSRVGAVVGATNPEEGRALRKRMPHTFFLVPGYGAQGGTAQDVAGMFDETGSGAIVNSSRGIIGAWKKSGRYSESMSADQALELVAESARQAAIDMRDALRFAVYR
ncbi:orotidine 5'-phosphate decarboxylase [Bifidobacterium sp. UTBIF-68]|uniref:orotidine-5'-phosphate decarboxylase n=1 Tax=Bifidobacterium sp. UTBIF-68 TaxID=1465262 RepID=UPI00112CBD63|nr:orotidine-5'-phosphate decarboxylase [Bifidobacterium sp. UTBIF-68]TPF93918.1 orotidine 5'-phosphate decarboxylase [Bifidobacterium sp. UTBIF-68]